MKKQKINDELFCTGIDLINSIDRDLRNKILDGTIKVGKKEIMKLPTLTKDELLAFIADIRKKNRLF